MGTAASCVQCASIAGAAIRTAQSVVSRTNAKIGDLRETQNLISVEIDNLEGLKKDCEDIMLTIDKTKATFGAVSRLKDQVDNLLGLREGSTGEITKVLVDEIWGLMDDG